MDFIRSKGERLADVLRERIQRGELLEPLPGTRAWSRKLGVARETLDQALRILRHEGVVTVYARGHRLNPSAIKNDGKKGVLPRVVHMLYYARDYRDLHISREWIFLLLERLHSRGIQLHLERCSDARLRMIANQEKQHGELFYLTAFNARHQRLFAKTRKAALVLGSPAPGASLPFITPDPVSSVAHATRLLLRIGFRHLNLLLAPFTNPGIKEILDAFESACGEWPHQPVRRQTVVVPLNDSEQLSAARRFASRVNGREGVVVVGPVPVGLILTALLERGIGVPNQVELVAMWPSLAALKLCPPVRYYPIPDLRFVKEIVTVSERYFESGELPPVHKRLPLELVEVGE